MGDVGLSHVDVRDIAEAAAIVLTTSGHEGKTYNLVGPQVHTGKNTAEIWSRVLGKTVTYGWNDLDAWEQKSLACLPAWMGVRLSPHVRVFPAERAQGYVLLLPVTMQKGGRK